MYLIANISITILDFKKAYTNNILKTHQNKLSEREHNFIL